MSKLSFKNARIVRSSWLEEGGRRLDCNPYMSGALEARDALNRINVPKEKLAEVTVAMFDSGRESRNWVDDPSYGVRYMGSSAISLADLSTLPLISKKQVARNPKLIIEEGWSLITRSGTIGRMAYVRPDMVGLACSEDVLRVVPDITRIPPGYLYAFLSSSYGLPLVVSGTYGAIIQHIEPEHIKNLEIPRFDDKLESDIHNMVEKAAHLRSRAARELREVVNQFDCLFPDADLNKKQEIMISPIPASQVQQRLDAEYHNPISVRVRQLLKNTPHSSIEEWCDDIFLPGIFKRIHVDSPEFSAPYYTGASLYWNEPEPKGFLSKVTKLFEQVRLKEGMVLVQAFGQEGGLTGRPVWVGKHLAESTTTHMLVRLIVHDRKRAAYLFGFLNSFLAYRQISCLTYGGSIPHFDVAGIKTVLIPRMNAKEEENIAERVLSAMADRDEALQLELDARLAIETLIDRTING
jgi:type I restriction enzyme S subunit